MNIAIFTDYYLPIRGGVQTAIYHQKRVLEGAGHSVIIVTPRHPKRAPSDDVIELPAYYTDPSDDVSLFFPLFGTRKRLKQQIIDRSIDVIHVQTEYGATLIGIELARQLDIPVVYTAHTFLWKQIDISVKHPTLANCFSWIAGWIFFGFRFKQLPRLPGESWRSQFWRSHVVALANLVDQVVSPSEHLAKKLQTWGVTRPIEVIPNFYSVTHQALPLPDTPTFLWLARMGPEKQPVFFARAVAHLRALAGDTNYRILFVGNGDEYEAARNIIGDDPHVELIPGVPHEEVESLYTRSSALVLTSYGFDNQPMVIVEALSYGRGVLLMDQDITEGLKTGAGYYAPYDTEKLAQAMHELINHPEKLEAMAQAAQKASHEFTPEAGLVRLESLYERVTKTVR